MSAKPAVSPDLLRIDAAGEAGRIVAGIREIVLGQLKRGGAVVGVSGGIESAVVAFLCARALGTERVFALFTPETESSPDSLRLGRMVAQALGVRSAVEDITPILRAAQCYQRRDETLRRAVPEYGDGYECRIIPPTVGAALRSVLFSVVVEAPDGRANWVPLSAEDYFDVVAAANFKQRARKMMEYYYADLLQYAVAGTPDRLEYDQGFFVKNGDGAADVKPIAHLYKSQVCQLAAHLGIPEEVRRQAVADACPLEQSQPDSYLLLPLEKMDFCLYGKNNGISAADLGAAVELDTDQVQRVYDAIQAKRMAAQYLRAAPVLVEEVVEVQRESHLSH
jgi:NAD+ synthase